jgi:hypothetical protein
LAYEIRLECESDHLVLYFREGGAPGWRVAGRHRFGSVQEARAASQRLSASNASELITAFEEWGSHLPTGLTASRTSARRD